MKEVLASQIPFKNHRSLSLKAAEPIVTRLILTYIQRNEAYQEWSQWKASCHCPYLLPAALEERDPETNEE